MYTVTRARQSGATSRSQRGASARRLQTVLEKLVEEISFTASERGGKSGTIDATDVRERVGALPKSGDFSKFIL
ncbi:MAG: hypothetical protein IPM60_12960 [Rhodospirillales bacterium]|nr:hypothetical protein [Rhodospirillales bacterium]